MSRVTIPPGLSPDTGKPLLIPVPVWKYYVLSLGEEHGFRRPENPASNSSELPLKLPLNTWLDNIRNTLGCIADCTQMPGVL